MRRIVFALLMVCTLLMGGCSRSPVADDVGQKEANEIVSILRERGIDSTVEKLKGGRGRYSVQVASKDFGESVSILASLGLPEERKASFTDLVAQSGILPSSREVEALRLDRASAAELEELLKGLPGVASASVVVRSHGLASGVMPSVSAVVQIHQGKTLSSEEVRTLLARTVPGLKSEEIVLSIGEQGNSRGKVSGSERPSSEMQQLVPFLRIWKVPKDQYAGLATLVVGLIFLVGAIAGLVGYVLGQYFLSRNPEFNVQTDNATPLGSSTQYDRLDAPDDVVDQGRDEEE
jgi:type III secretory pathway lipoprotein EscJ